MKLTFDANINKQRRNRIITTVLLSVVIIFIVTGIAYILTEKHVELKGLIQMWWNANIICVIIIQFIIVDYFSQKHASQKFLRFINKYGITKPNTEFWFTVCLILGAVFIDVGGAVIYSLIRDSISIDKPSVSNTIAYSGLVILLATQTMVIVVPIFEEIVFRGMLINALLYGIFKGPYFIGKHSFKIRFDGIAPIYVLLLSSIIFAVGHGIDDTVPFLISGLVLGVLRMRTGSIIPCVIVHAIHNMMVIVL